MTAERLAAENARHDRLLWLLAVCSLGIVSAYPVGPGNPDARFHLAAGRLIVHGEYRYGSDPFAYGEHAPQGWSGWQRLLGTLGLGPKQLDWVNIGWLADVLFYCCYGLAGGAGLVILRVVLVVTVAGVVWRICCRLIELQSRSPAATRDGSVSRRVASSESGAGHANLPGLPRPAPTHAFVAWGTVGLVLAGLVWSVRMHIRPESWGLLYLACMLAVVTAPAVELSKLPAGESPGRWRGYLLAGLRRTRGRWWFLLPVLFVLWANCDTTVLLGLTVLVLYWFGQHLQAMWGPDRYARDALLHEDRRLLGRIIVLCVAATAINPFHLHVFDPSPLWFSESAELLRQRSPQAARWGVSPFSAAYFTDADGRWVGLSLAEWAYYLLLLFTAAGLWLGRARWRWSWFLLALLGLILSCYEVRYTAWFAPLALPGALPGWWHYLAERFGTWPATKRRAVLLAQLGRLMLFLAWLGLMLATLWPLPSTGTAAGSVTRRGWGFSLIEDASLQTAAEVTAGWRRTGRLSGRGLHLAWVNTAGYWASAHGAEPAVWLDLRAGLFTPKTVRDFLDAVEALEKTGTPEGQRERRRWQELLRQYDISHLIVHSDNLVSRYDARGNRVRLPLLPLLLADRDDQGRPVWQMLDYVDGETFLLAWTGSPHWQQLQSLCFVPGSRLGSEWGAGGVSPPWSGRQPAVESRVGREMEPRRTLRIYFTGQPTPVPLATTAARWAAEVSNQLREPRYLQSRQRAEGEMLWTTLIATTAALPVVGVSGTLAQVGSVFVEGWPNLPRLPSFAYQRDALLWLAWRWARQGILDAPQQPYAWAVCYDVANLLDIHESQFSNGARHESRLLARMFLLRQLARLQPGLANVHLELARRFLERGCDDLALVHAESYLQIPAANTDQADSPQKRLQEHLGMSLEQLRTRVQEARERFPAWLPILTQPGWLQARPAEALARAREMWQSRLAGTTLTILQQLTRSLSPRQPEFAEAVRLLADVYVQVGDAVSLQRLLQQSWAQAILGRERYALLQALAAGALGDAPQEAQRREELEALLRRQSAELFLRGSVAITLGSDVGPAGSSFYGLMQQQQSLMRSRERIYNLLAIASAALEAGEIPRARDAFDQVRRIAPREPLAALAEHYLRLLPQSAAPAASAGAADSSR